MEIDKKIVGYTLVEILKRDFDNKLTFRNPSNNREYYLEFDGLMFETSYPVLNKKIERAELSDILGFKAATQLRYLGQNPSDYKQLLIKMSNSIGEYKIEIICAFRHYSFRER